MWGLHNRLRNIYQFTIPVSGSQFSGSQFVGTEVSGTTARFANYTGPTGGQATFTSASIQNLIASGTITTASLAINAISSSHALRAVSSSHAIRSDQTTINYVQNILTASVALNNNNQFTRIMTLTVPSGTWMVNAVASAASTVETDMFVRVNTGSVMFASQGQSVAGPSIQSPYAAGFSLSFPLIATESVELSFEGAQGGTGGQIILATLNSSFDFFSGGNTYPNNGNTATMITAYRIG